MKEDLLKYLRPEVIAGLKSIDLKARLIVEGFISGLHRSPFRGRSVEFADFRTYNPGDDLKSIDWKVLARTDRFYVKEYEERTNLTAHLLLDASNSMSYGKRITKYEYASCLAASISYILIKQRDSVGIWLFDNRIRKFLWPSSRESQLQQILQLLGKSNPASRTNIATTIAEIASKIKRRGLVMIFSDLHYNPEDTIKSISLLRTMKNEVVVFLILDPDERFFPFKTQARFQDLETKQEILIDPRLIRKDYIKRIEKMIGNYQEKFLNQNIDFMSLTTDTPFDEALFRFLEIRKKMWSS
ncbi:MAG TPA: DUF58 domain-containing protein [bacterium (Candidatus Stahlbacteria)]|nr:DUF58 domain-containing protein [Candidatus Stahlbacteria bacterium]